MKKTQLEIGFDNWEIELFPRFPPSRIRNVVGLPLSEKTIQTRSLGNAFFVLPFFRLTFFSYAKNLIKKYFNFAFCFEKTLLRTNVKSLVL